MRRIIILLFGIISLSLISACGKEEGVELATDFPASVYDIEGTYRMERNAYYYTFTFADNSYHLSVYNAILDMAGNTKIVLEESGSYTMEGNVITLTTAEGNASVYSPLEAFWTSLSKYTLNLKPMGSFVRR